VVKGLVLSHSGARSPLAPLRGERDATPTRSTRASGAPVGVRGTTQRFAGDGMRYYWRFVRILLLVGMLSVGVTMILTMGFEAIGGSFDERGWPLASMWVDNLTLLMWLVVFGVSSLIVDVARIFMLRRDDFRAVAAVRQAFGFIGRNAGAVVAIGLAFLVLLVAALVIYNLIASGITPLSWGLIAFTIAWQQFFALMRTTLRVGLLAALATLVDARVPRPIDAPVDVTSVEEPVYELPMLG
jgi:hypothetical protein